MYFSRKLLTKSPVSGSSEAVGSSNNKIDGVLIKDGAVSGVGAAFNEFMLIGA